MCFWNVLQASWPVQAAHCIPAPAPLLSSARQECTASCEGSGNGSYCLAGLTKQLWEECGNAALTNHTKAT